MEPLFVIGLQATFSMVVFALLAIWYVVPELAKSKPERALMPLLFVNVFRYLPMALFMPGQISPDFPQDVLIVVAYGDLAASVVALIALLMLRYKIKIAMFFVWIFSIVSMLDIVHALFEAMSARVYNLPLGANYFIVSVYVPMIIVVQAVIFYQLVGRRRVTTIPSTEMLKTEC